MSRLTEYLEVFSEADCLVDEAQVESAVAGLANQLNAYYQSEESVLALVVMKGAVIPAGLILPRLSFPCMVDYIHASRYQGELHGDNLKWFKQPSMSLKGQHVLIIDDVLDHGVTLQKIAEYCHSKSAKSVKTLALINKKVDIENRYTADFIGLDVEDRYIFGLGMDYKEYGRTLNKVMAVKTG